MFTIPSLLWMNPSKAQEKTTAEKAIENVYLKLKIHLQLPLYTWKKLTQLEDVLQDLWYDLSEVNIGYNKQINLETNTKVQIMYHICSSQFQVNVHIRQYSRIRPLTRFPLKLNIDIKNR